MSKYLRCILIKQDAINWLTKIFLGMLAALGMSFASANDQNDRFMGLIDPIVAQSQFTIGATLVHLQDDFWKGIAYGIVDEAERSNVKVTNISVAGNYGKVKEQFSQLDILDNKGTDVIVLGAAAFDGYDNVLRQLRKNGRKIIAAGVPVNSDQVDFGVMQDDYKVGEILTEVLCNSMEKKDNNPTVLALQGPAGGEWAAHRLDAFHKAIKECAPNVNVINGPAAEGLGVGRGLKETSDILLRNDNIGYIFTPETSLAVGAAQATQNSQRDDIKIVGSTLDKNAISMIKNGRLYSVVSEPGILIGRLVVQNAIRLMNNEQPVNIDNLGRDKYPVINVRNVAVTIDNVDTYELHDYDVPPPGWSIDAFQ